MALGDERTVWHATRRLPYADGMPRRTSCAAISPSMRTMYPAFVPMWAISPAARAIVTDLT